MRNMKAALLTGVSALALMTAACSADEPVASNNTTVIVEDNAADATLNAADENQANEANAL